MPTPFKQFKPFAGTSSLTFKDPDTGHVFQAETKPLLVKHILNYRAQNRLPEIEHLDIVLENYWCKLPQNKHLCQDCDPKLYRGFLAYLRGGIQLFKMILYQSFVSQEEADRRAKICKTCEFNIFPDKQGFLLWSDAIAEASVEDRKTSEHEALGNCKICSCVLKAKVWKPEPFGLPAKEVAKLPSYCWQKK